LPILAAGLVTSRHLCLGTYRWTNESPSAWSHR